ncbi:50S ribosomal protein L3 [uncultured archaeon]|nr:50S ribosomal protein L3 [uncultured archaeon]
MGYSPRKRAKRIFPRVMRKAQGKEVKPTEFAGYKVGMLHLMMINDKKGTPISNQEIAVPATLIEVPPLKVLGVRAYKNTAYGPKVAGEVWTDKTDKTLLRTIKSPKKIKASFENLEKKVSQLSDIMLLTYTQPKSAGIDKKRPEIIEVGIGGQNVADKLKYAKEKLGGEIPVVDVFKSGEFIDSIAITKGKGFQGSVYRWGLKLLSHKSQKLHRKAGNLGPWHPHKTRPMVPQMGQMGFHKRTEYNKRVLKVGTNIKEIAKKGGWKNYGEITSDYIIVKGSIQGPAKRLVRLRAAIRPAPGVFGNIEVTKLGINV